MHCVCVCVCACVRAHARARVCEREREMVTSQPRLVCKHIGASLLCLSRDSVPLSGLN